MELENSYNSIFWLYFINAQLGYKLEKLVNKPAIQSMTAQVIWERISLITIFFHARLFAIFISHKKTFITRHNCATHSLSHTFLSLFLFRAIENMIKQQHQHKTIFSESVQRWVFRVLAQVNGACDRRWKKWPWEHIFAPFSCLNVFEGNFYNPFKTL